VRFVVRTVSCVFYLRQATLVSWIAVGTGALDGEETRVEVFKDDAQDRGK
jgi:hypothetical protein